MVSSANILQARSRMELCFKRAFESYHKRNHRTTHNEKLERGNQRGSHSGVGGTMAPITSHVEGIPNSTDLPPDGKTHHTFHADRKQSEDAPAVKFSCLTHSTFHPFFTGHAFTGEYTQWFFSQHIPEQVACQCGEVLQTINSLTHAVST